MTVSLEEVRARIAHALPGALVEVTDLTGTSDHFEAVVVAPQFAGRSRIEQHKLVYGALGDAVGREIHALALKTRPPETAGSEGGIEETKRNGATEAKGT